MTAVEIITSKEKRRYWMRAEKMRWILALNEPDANASDVARRAGVSTSLLALIALSIGLVRMVSGQGMI